jgi:hypothetical protein
MSIVPFYSDLDGSTALSNFSCSLRSKWPGNETDHSLLRLRMNRVIPPLLLMLTCCAQGLLYMTLQNCISGVSVEAKQILLVIIVIICSLFVFH